jgi:PX domain
MSLAVEVAGFGLCQTASPYSILVICVQQETFQAWTVYRRYSSFVSLAEQLQILHPSIPNVPKYNPDNLSMDNLDHCRSAMDNW